MKPFAILCLRFPERIFLPAAMVLSDVLFEGSAARGHQMEAVRRISKDAALRIAGIPHDSNPPIARSIDRIPKMKSAKSFSNLFLLQVKISMTAGAIASNFEAARPTVSKHLQILTQCGLLKPEQEGREIYYHLNPEKMKAISEFLEPFRRLWDERFNKLEQTMKSYKPDK